MELKKYATDKLKVHIILWFLSAFILAAGIMNLHSSLINTDYRCIDAEIIDVEEKKVLEKQGFVMRYNYKIIWYADSVRHVKYVHKAVEYPYESHIKVWVNSDNTDALLGDPSEAKESAYENFIVAIITFILGMLFAPRHNKKKKLSVDTMESIYYQAIIMAVLMVFGDLLMLFRFYISTSRHIYVNPVYWDLAGVFTIVLVISIVIIVKLRRKLK